MPNHNDILQLLFKHDVNFTQADVACVKLTLAWTGKVLDPDCYRDAFFDVLGDICRNPACNASDALRGNEGEDEIKMDAVMEDPIWETW